MAEAAESVLQRLAEDSTPVELLVAGCTATETNQCATTLRNYGQAVHLRRAESIGALAAMVEEDVPRLMIVNADNAVMPLLQTLEIARQANPAVALLLISNDIKALLPMAMEHDARDVVDISDMEHLAFAIRREHQTLRLREELLSQRHQLHEVEQRFDALMGKSRDAIAYVHEGMHIHANSVYASMFQIDDPGDIEGLPLMDLVAPDSRPAFKKILRNLEKDNNFSTEVNCQTDDGSVFSATMEFSPAEVEGEPCTQIVIRDESLHDELQARLNELTNRDPHTQLLNRQAFMERLEAALATDRLSSATGLVQVSIKNFSDLCEKAGLKQTDKLLQAVASNLSNCADNASALAVARFGDHDFMILVHGGGDIQPLAEQCLSALNAQDFVNSCDLLDTPLFSLGVTHHPNEGRLSAHELVSRSCKATKNAQNQDGSQIVEYAEAKQAKVEHKDVDASTLDLIDNALANDGFRLVYQPIVSLQGDSRENYSVMLRLLNQHNDEQPPENFLAQAKAANRLADIDRWVVRHAIAELDKHRRDGKRINFHIMLSQDGMADESMLLWVCDCLREFKAKGAWLVFQFSTQDLRSTLKPARKLIDGLKKINCRIAISHYENKSSHKALIQHLPMDIVRLSPSFVDNLANDEDQQDLLNEVNEQLQEQGVKTIATGVEDANSLAVLWNVRVNYIQGYFLQTPSSTIAFDED